MKNNLLKKYMKDVSRYSFCGYYTTIYTDLDIGDAVFITRKGGVYSQFKTCANYFGITSWLTNECQLQCEDKTNYWIVKNMVVHPDFDEIICHLINLKGENVMICEKHLAKRHLNRNIKLKLQEKFNFEDFHLKRLDNKSIYF